MSQTCALCGETSEAGTAFLRCSQCKTAYYCSKECQAKHWKNGHKSQCKKPIEKFFVYCFAQPQGRDDTSSLSLSRKYTCTAAHIWEAFTDAKTMAKYTLSPAKSTLEVGGGLSMYDGSILGQYLEIEPLRKLVLYWRKKEWADSSYSTVTILISQLDEDVTSVEITQEYIPQRDRFSNPDVPFATKEGWNQLILDLISKILGYAAVTD